MGQPAVMQAQINAPDQQVQKLTERVTQLEAELAMVKAELQWALTNLRNAAQPAKGQRVVISPFSDVMAWQPSTPEKLTYLQTLSEDELVPIHYMTDEDVRQSLNEFEQKYRIRSEEFYARLKHGAADEIEDKSTWGILYRAWLQITTEEQQLVEVAA